MNESQNKQNKRKSVEEKSPKVFSNCPSPVEAFLLELRKKFASKKGVFPYSIFSSQHLKILAEKLPNDKTEVVKSPPVVDFILFLTF